MIRANDKRSQLKENWPSAATSPAAGPTRFSERSSRVGGSGAVSGLMDPAAPKSVPKYPAHTWFQDTGASLQLPFRVFPFLGSEFPAMNPRAP